MPDRQPIDTELRRLLEADPDRLRSVAIWFTQLPGPAELSRLELAGTTVNPVLAMVDAAQAYALAERPDVARISFEPGDDLH